MQKKVPVRMCIACREGKPKRELIRVVKNKEGEIFIDLTGKANGRRARPRAEERTFVRICSALIRRISRKRFHVLWTQRFLPRFTKN